MILNNKDFYKVSLRFKYSEFYFLLFILIIGIIFNQLYFNYIGLGTIISGIGLGIFYKWEIKQGF